MRKIQPEEVMHWTERLLVKAEKELSAKELKEQRMFSALVANPKNKVILTKLLDESAQIRHSKILSNRIKTLFSKYGVPGFFGKGYELMGHVFRQFGYHFDFIAVPFFKAILRKETSNIIIKEERPALTKHLLKRKQEKIGQNVNLLGEVVLGDAEAENRYQHYIAALREPDINYISIKISGIYAQIRPLQYAKSKNDLCERIATIYQTAIDHPYTDDKGRTVPKFVNLDMEEYKDTELTLDVFITVLSMPQFKDYTAGIVVQAYLPEAELFYQRLLNFALKRVEVGGAPIKVRLVKGANQQMESIVSSLKGWPNPILPTKIHVDANYMHLLDLAMQPEHIKAVHLGVASHNLFTIGYAHLLSLTNDVEEFVSFEMLEGMANHLPRVMRNLEKQIILYTPVVRKEHFLNAISYLVRRLDENTGKDNFLTYSFNLKLNSKEWVFLREQFLEAYNLKDTMQPCSYRNQNRNMPPIPCEDLNTFSNEPDTDLDLKPNRKWALAVLEKWKETKADDFVIPVQIGAREVQSDEKRYYYDHSRNDEVCCCEVNMATPEQVKQIISIAEEDAPHWRNSSLAMRNKILHDVADLMSERRGDLIGCMATITGKTFTEGDVEISEGIDFCRYYPLTMKRFEEMETLAYSAKGVVLVIPPWNFPFAIPVGGVAAALSGGNSVILKPATVAFPVAWQFAKCFWDAGVPKETLQLVCPAERESLDMLSAHPSVKHIILTGGTDTALKLLKNSPKTPLSAETGGKNAIIVTASADQDHAIQNIVSSAFGNAGQKCSACSLLLLDKHIYNDETFKLKLKDAVTSMQTGSTWDTENVIGPMITNCNDKLHHAINTLEQGEWWLVPPHYADKEQYILKPCVKWGVMPDSYTFKTELFAPLLAVTCIENLDEGIRLANSTEYGLTAGLQSLDEDEILKWKEHIQAGNLYINRGITGAIVSRQPFGGMKRSAFGAGIKAGGPNYAACFVNFTEKDAIKDLGVNHYIAFARDSFASAWQDEFSVERDISFIMGELNTFRYLPMNGMAIRLYNHDTLPDALLCIYAAAQTGTQVTLSMPAAFPFVKEVQQAVSTVNTIKISVDSEEEFVSDMYKYSRIRTCSENLPESVYQEAAKLGLYLATATPVAEGRVELLHYLKEQSISYEYHRYGSIVEEPEREIQRKKQTLF